MNRRELIKGGATVGALSVLARMVAWTGLGLGALAFGPCNTGSLVSWTTEIVDALQRMSPILAQLGVPNIVKLVADAVTVANDLKAAFANNDTQTFPVLFDKLSALVDQIANDLGLISIAFRVELEAILALASIAIHLIADHLKKTVVAVGAQSTVRRAARSNPELQKAVVTIDTKATEKPWGSYFHK